MPCENGTQTWTSYLYPGVITPHPTGTEDYDIRGKFKGELASSASHSRLAACILQQATTLIPELLMGPTATTCGR